MGVILLGFQAFGSLGALGTFDQSFFFYGGLVGTLVATFGTLRCSLLLAHFDALLLQILGILGFWASPELEALAV